MQNNYLTEDAKKQLIKILTDEYEKILISETISKSNKSTLQKQEIAEIVDYLQNSKNLTYADLYKLNEARKGWGWLGSIGKWLGLGTAGEQIGQPLMPMYFDPIGIIPDPFVGPGGQGGGGPYPGGWNPAEHGWPRPEERDPGFVGPPYYGPDDPANQPPENLPESMKALEIVDYLQNNQNVTHADLSELNEARKGWGWLGKLLGAGAAEEIGQPLMPMYFDPIGIIPDPFVGPGGQGNPGMEPLDKNPYIGDWPQPHERDPDFVGPRYYGPDDPLNQPPENLPESMKAFWKNRLLEKINHK